MTGQEETDLSYIMLRKMLWAQADSKKGACISVAAKSDIDIASSVHLCSELNECIQAGRGGRSKFTAACNSMHACSSSKTSRDPLAD